MEMVNHINYPNEKSQIYCRKLNKVIVLDKEGKFWNSCHLCSMFAGDYQGMGVECQWDDVTDDYSKYVSDPFKELLRVSKCIDLHMLKKQK